MRWHRYQIGLVKLGLVELSLIYREKTRLQPDIKDNLNYKRLCEL